MDTITVKPPKINKIANKILFYQNATLLFFTLFIYFFIPFQFERYLMGDKLAHLQQMNESISSHSTRYLGHIVGSQLADEVKSVLYKYFSTNSDFIGFAVIPTPAEGTTEVPLFYNQEKIGELKELLSYDTDETIIKKEKNLLKVITPVFSKDSGEEKVARKRGYLVSGFSLQDQHHTVRKLKIVLLAICAFFILCVNGGGHLLRRQITTSLTTCTALIRGAVHGDLREMVPLCSNDELGRLSITLNTMVKTWKQKIEEIRNIIESSRVVSTEIAHAAHQKENSTVEQASSINEIAATIEELNTNSKLIHKKAEEVAKKSQKLLDVSFEGLKTVNKSIERFALVQEYVNTIAEYLLNLCEEIHQIGMILKEVRTIATQTDMLAINAGIRAAKVRDRGREFVIIASEIRVLSNQSQNAAAKISFLIEEIQASTHSTVMAMEQGIKRVEEGIKLILETGKTIDIAIINVKETVDSVNEISLASHQQFLGTNQVTQSVVDINRGMHETASASTHTMRETESLKKVQQEVSEVIGFYKV